MDAIRLHDAIAAVAPIDGVSVGSKDNKKTWRIDFAGAATPAQKVAAQAAIAAFDPDAPGLVARDPLAEIDALKATLVAKAVITKG